MRSFVFIAVLAVAVNARPEPPSGYNYRAPAQQSFGGNGGHSHGGHGHGGSAGHGGSFSHGGGVSSGFGNGGSFGQGGAVSSGFGNGGSFGGNGGSFGGNGGSFGGNGGFAGPQQTIVQKHIYVHVPPPEEEAQVAAAQQQFVQPRKHYKIIFIKAPSAPSITQQIAAAQAQNEEKTLIYVLVKKPEDISIPEAPAQAQLPVSKPEVYFIKYKTQKDGGAGGAIGGGASSFGGDSFSSGNAGSFGGSTGGGFSAGGFDAPAANPQASYGVPIKK